MLSDRELLLATAQRRREERLLYNADFAGKCRDKVLSHYGLPDMVALNEAMGFFRAPTVYPRRRPDTPVFDYSGYYTDIAIPDGVEIDANGVLQLPGSAHHFRHLISPLRNVYDWEEILQFPIYKRPEYYDFSGMKSEVERIHARGQAAQVWVGRLFETSWPLRGYENLLADMLAEPEAAEYFFRLEHTWNLALAAAAVEAGADMLSFGDDVGNQNAMTFSAELWRQMIKPRWAEVFALAKRKKPDIVLWYHSCGKIQDIIPDFIEIGLDILNPIQPECMDIYTLQKQYGAYLSFDGGLGTQRLMPFGTPGEVEAEVERLTRVFGANGGFILAPAHVLEPEVPIENIDAYIRAAQKYCRRQ